MSIAIGITLSIIAQSIMTVLFTKEMLTTQLGTYCKVKSGLAAPFYCSFVVLLSWILFTQFINPSS